MAAAIFLTNSMARPAYLTDCFCRTPEDSMTQTTRAVLMAAILCVTCSGTADAAKGFLAWLEELSGPGPSTGLGGIVLDELIGGSSAGGVSVFGGALRKAKRPIRWHVSFGVSHFAD